MELDQAKHLKPGDRVHYVGKRSCTREIGPKGGVTIHVTECRISGLPKLWVTFPGKVRVPVKYGLYEHTYITDGNLEEWHLETECPLRDEVDLAPSSSSSSAA